MGRGSGDTGGDAGTSDAEVSAAVSAAYHGAMVEVVARQLVTEGTFAAEIVSFRLPDGATRRVFCKHGGDQPLHADGGHRRGVSYEARVYRDVLSQLPVSTARYMFDGPIRSGHCLILEDLSAAVPVNESRDPSALQRVARWAADLHRLSASAVSRWDRTITVLDTMYYEQLTNRAAEAATAACDVRLATLIGDVAPYVQGLARATPSLVHGEFFASNILYLGRTVLPVDWETTAIGAAAIDVAALVMDWGSSTTREVLDAYTEHAQVPAGALREYVAAGIAYWSLRWVCQWGPGCRWAVFDLREAARLLGAPASGPWPLDVPPERRETDQLDVRLSHS